MKLLAQLEDEGHIYELDLRKLLNLLHIEISDEEVVSKVLQEISKT